jgi:hypothetical protein
MTPKTGTVEAPKPEDPAKVEVGKGVLEKVAGAPTLPPSPELNPLSAKPVVGMTDAPAGAPKDADLGAVHKEFAEKVGKVDEATAGKDLETLTGKSADAFTIEDIRHNSRLLKKAEADEKPEAVVANLKDETARRIKAYTKDSGDGWFAIDYEKLGADKNNLTHELYVGLGDILLDPEIQEILVEKGGEKIKAHRGIVPNGKHYSGRVAFLDENNDYVATHTGDKFRILSSDKLEPAKYVEKLKVDDDARKGARNSFRSSTVDLVISENDATMRDAAEFPPMSADYVDENGNPAKVEVTRKLIEDAANDCSKPVGDTKKDMEKAVIERKSLMKLVNYIAAETDVPAYAIMGVLFKESRIHFPAAIGDLNTPGGAQGMGQFHLDAMADVKQSQLFHKLVGQVVKENPGSVGRNKNIFVDLVAVAVFLKKQAKRFGFKVSGGTPAGELTEEIVTSADGFGLTRLAWIRMGYHVPAFAAVYAQLLKVGSVDKLTGANKTNYPVAQKWLVEHKPSYNAFSEISAAAQLAMKQTEAGTASA